MLATIDPAGRVLVPKTIRRALAWEPGTRVDIALYGDGVQVSASPRSASLVREGDHLVISGSTPLTDEDLFALIDAGRK